MFAALPILALDLSLLHSLLDEGFVIGTPSRAVGRCCFEICWVDDILVAQGGSTGWPYSGGKLAIKNVFWDATVVLPAYLSEPVQVSLREGDKHA
jgi:hypothetical protein